MKKLKTILRIIGNSIAISIFGLVGVLLFEFRIPGHQNYTDHDSMFMGIANIIFVFIGISLIINSSIFRVKNHWKKFRTGVIILVIGFGLAVFLPREIIKWTFFGEKKVEFTSLKNPDFIWVNLELYKNNNFLCSTSHGGEMTVENLGKYELKNNNLKLSFENGISEHAKKYYKTLSKNIGTSYKILNDTLICLDCEKEIKLKKN